MTIAETHTYIDIRLDKANAAWFTPAEKDNFIIQAVNEYVKVKHKLFETNEKVREDLLTLVSEPFVVAASSTIDLDAVPDFLFVLRLEADIDSECGFLTGVPVTPMQQ